LSVFINARGATSLDTWKWSQPATDQQLRARLWDWDHPQFLAGLQSLPPPVEFPLLQPPTEIDLTTHANEKYLWYGWSGAESDLRWTDGREATFVFSVPDTRELLLEIRLAPFLSDSRLSQQDLSLKLNNELLTSVALSDGEMKDYSFRLPKNSLQPRNVLSFALPDAASPASFGTDNDRRLLGIRVKSMRFAYAE
jgi:hypothetical protein